MGNFEKLSVLVIVVIIVMILVVAVYTWQDEGPDTSTTQPEETSALNIGTSNDNGGETDSEWDWDKDPAVEPEDPAPESLETLEGPAGEEPMLPDSPTPADPEVTADLPEANAEWVYTVKGGDALSLISQRELGTIRRQRDILALNPGLDPDRLTVGQKLRMPPKGAVGGATSVSGGDNTSSARGGAALSPGAEFYVTQGRERLAEISKRAFGNIERWPEIFALNTDVIRNPNDIPPGTKIRLRR